MSDLDICKWGKYSVIRFLPSDVEAILRAYKQSGIDGISLSSRDGCSEESLKALREFEGLKILLIRDLPNMSMRALKFFPDLEEISLDITKQPLDLSLLPSLKRLTCDWSPNLLQNSNLSRLTSLRISKFKSVNNDLSDFPFLPNLQELELVQSTIAGLNGISQFAGLKQIELHYLSKLTTLDGLNLPELTAFFASGCKKLADHEQLAACVNLEDLKLHECGAMKSVHFVDSLKKLKTFRFIKTDVLDGDLSPLLRLDDVYFTEKRHFSHKVSDMRQSPPSFG